MGMPRAVDQFSPERGGAPGDHRMGVSGGNRLAAFAGVIRPICGSAADVLIGRDLVLKIWQHGSVPDVAAGDFSCPNFQCFFVNSDVNLTPNTPFRATLCPATHA
jgi:hypothetical protein